MTPNGAKPRSQLRAHVAHNWEGREERHLQGALIDTKAAAESRSKAATEAYRDLLPISGGFATTEPVFRAITEKLNTDGNSSDFG